MHELTEKLIKEDGQEINDIIKHIYKSYDKIIIDWLKEKAKKIEEFKRIHGDFPVIKNILGIAEESLEDKLRYEAGEVDGLLGTSIKTSVRWEKIAQIAKSHFKAHPEELE